MKKITTSRTINQRLVFSIISVTIIYLCSLFNPAYSLDKTVFYLFSVFNMVLTRLLYRLNVKGPAAFSIFFSVFVLYACFIQLSPLIYDIDSLVIGAWLAVIYSALYTFYLYTFRLLFRKPEEKE
ncbi:hypothetical protein ACWOAH_09335 [Vagococcus vulneris]|uniref:Uncharacterized protein n=1 Tax=Vagococcus vulneris TaxID=1977869 RepID=A0A429ZVA3_9ENTE|nr:hypothetical protein [Vagococcus vulneris]RST97603.1 hypothetical protein CBF37_09525 [Vagococcus vulneris]